MAISMALNPTSTINPEAILQAEVDRYVENGYRLASQTPTAAQLVRPKKFSLIWAFIWFVIAVWPLLIYLVYYMFWEHQVYLVVDENGRIKRT